VEVGQESPEELAAATKGLATNAEQAGMSQDGAQSLPKLVTEYEDDFSLKLGAEPPVLCAGKDETSVDIMGRMFCCNFLRKSRL
jgi:hypothetical protein